MECTAALGLTCVTAGEASATSEQSAQRPDQRRTNEEWAVLEVSDYPFDVRYRSGYEADAKQVRDWGIYAHGVIQELYRFECDEPFTFDVYPASEYHRPHGNMTYMENKVSVELVTPSEYAGGYANTDQFFRHGVVHEYVHAVQNSNLSFHTHANWYMEGLAEAVAVYHTTDGIRETYHENHGRSQQTQNDIRRGFGYLLGVNEFVYRGSMHLLQFMLTQYGSESVFEITEQSAHSMIEAVDMSLGQTPLDIQADWLKYAQIKYGGDYRTQINRLGDSVPAHLEVGPAPYENDSITVDRAVHDGADYKIVVYDEDQTAVEVSDTYPAGEWAADFEASFDRQLKNPSPFTVQLHEARTSGYGDLVEVYGEELKREKLYATARSAVGFAEPMRAGDTSVRLHVHVGAGFEAERGFLIHVLDGDASSAKIHDGFHEIRGNVDLIDIEIPLDTQTGGVPLSEGQTLTIVIQKHIEGDEVAKRTQDVLAESSSRESYTATPVEATATVTAAAATAKPAASATTARGPNTGASAAEAAVATETTGTAGEDGATTTASTPGFGIGAALSGLAGGIAVLRWLNDPDDEER